MELVCIVCPNSCRLDITKNPDGSIAVNGQKCKRGEKFANDEVTNPMRSVTSSVKTTVEGYPVVSVKTNGEIPKSKIFELMKVLAGVTLTSKLEIGSVIIPNALNTGVDVVTTTSMEGGN